MEEEKEAGFSLRKPEELGWLVGYLRFRLRREVSATRRALTR